MKRKQLKNELTYPMVNGMSEHQVTELLNVFKMPLLGNMGVQIAFGVLLCEAICWRGMYRLLLSEITSLPVILLYIMIPAVAIVYIIFAFKQHFSFKKTPWYKVNKEILRARLQEINKEELLKKQNTSLAMNAINSAEEDIRKKYNLTDSDISCYFRTRWASF